MTTIKTNKIKVGQRVVIQDIPEEDAYYLDKDKYIGQEATVTHIDGWIAKEERWNEYQCCDLKLNDGTEHAFFKIKLAEPEHPNK